MTLDILAVGALFVDDFEDGGVDWQTLKAGESQLVEDPVDGWVLRKTTHNDTNGAWAALGAESNDFELVVHARKVFTTGGDLVRYSVTDQQGDGYGAVSGISGRRPGA